MRGPETLLLQANEAETNILMGDASFKCGIDLYNDMSGFPLSNEPQPTPSSKFDQYYMGATTNIMPSSMSFQPFHNSTTKFESSIKKQFMPILERVCEQIY